MRTVEGRREEQGSTEGSTEGVKEGGLRRKMEGGRWKEGGGRKEYGLCGGEEMFWERERRVW